MRHLRAKARPKAAHLILRSFFRVAQHSTALQYGYMDGICAEHPIERP
jgi:hypothetical protein